MNRDLGNYDQHGEEEENEDDIDEDEVIDVAERVFFRIAEEVIKQERTSIRNLFADQIFETEVDGQPYELLTPDGLLDGIKALGINDLTEKDCRYLLRVLTKPELDGAIVVNELLQIMENLGFTEGDPDDESEEEDEPED